MPLLLIGLAMAGQPPASRPARPVRPPIERGPLLNSPEARIDTGPDPLSEGPPEPMIDFLGRRRDCSTLSPERIAAARPGDRIHWLRCRDLAAEEVALRRRYEGHGRAIFYLDQLPSEFRAFMLEGCFDCGPHLSADRAEQSGTAGGGTLWHVRLERDPVGAVAVRVDWGGISRTVTLDATRFPHIDLGSLRASISPQVQGGPHRGISVRLRYDFDRGWCVINRDDDRPEVHIWVQPEETRISRQDRTNCNVSFD